MAARKTEQLGAVASLVARQRVARARRLWHQVELAALGNLSDDAWLALYRRFDRAAKATGSRAGGRVSIRIPTKAKCIECGRVFNLLDEDDAGEWHYGHDCEAG